MRRRRPSRLLALPLSLWFVALATDSGHLDACPMHHAMMAGHAAGDNAHGAMVPMGSMASATSMAAMARLDPASDGTAPADDGRPVQCRCIGTCCGGSMLTLPISGPALLSSLGVPTRGVPKAAASEPRSAAESFRQPPSIGPPVLHSA